MVGGQDPAAPRIDARHVAAPAALVVGNALINFGLGLRRSMSQGGAGASGACTKTRVPAAGQKMK